MIDYNVNVNDYVTAWFIETSAKHAQMFPWSIFFYFSYLFMFPSPVCWSNDSVSCNHVILQVLCCTFYFEHLLFDYLLDHNSLSQFYSMFFSLSRRLLQSDMTEKNASVRQNSWNHNCSILIRKQLVQTDFVNRFNRFIEKIKMNGTIH